jgi:hypothetical protein
LPEVFHRRLYEKKGFGSIFEFAAKLAGMSQEQVRVVLNLERKFEDKPVLKNLLINGEVSANKLVRIASIATVENQQVLACMAEKLSNRAIETFVRDEKWAMNGSDAGAEFGEKIGVRMAGRPGDFKTQNGLQKPLFDDKSLHVHSNLQPMDEGVNLSQFESSASPLEIIKLKLDKDVLKKLLELQEKNIDVNGLIREMLQNRMEGIAQEKEEIVDTLQSHKQPSRYIPARIRKIITEEQGDKCSVPNCKNRAEVTHHELPFAIARNHDPRNLQKLCKAHHELKHMVDVRFFEARVGRAGSG